MAYQIGEKIYWRGFEVTIISEPYTMAGGEFQDGDCESGKRVMVPTPENVAARVQKNRDDHAEMQAGFRRIRERQNEMTSADQKRRAK